MKNFTIFQMINFYLKIAYTCTYQTINIEDDDLHIE